MQKARSPLHLMVGPDTFMGTLLMYNSGHFFNEPLVQGRKSISNRLRTLDSCFRPGLLEADFWRLFMKCRCGFLMTRRAFKNHPCTVEEVIDLTSDSDDVIDLTADSDEDCPPLIIDLTLDSDD